MNRLLITSSVFCVAVVGAVVYFAITKEKLPITIEHMPRVVTAGDEITVVVSWNGNTGRRYVAGIVSEKCNAEFTNTGNIGAPRREFHFTFPQHVCASDDYWLTVGILGEAEIIYQTRVKFKVVR